MSSARSSKMATTACDNFSIIAHDGGESVTSEDYYDQTLTRELLNKIRTWVDKLPLNRKRLNLHREFSDGFLMAELINFLFPKVVDVHGIVTASATKNKRLNWNYLNTKALPKIGLKLKDDTIEDIIKAKPGAIESALYFLYVKVNEQKLQECDDNDNNKVRASGDNGNYALQQEMCYVQHGKEIPEFILYKNEHKFLPEHLLERSDSYISELESGIKELRNKVRRLETVMELKEEHLEELTAQLQELKLKSSSKVSYEKSIASQKHKTTPTTDAPKMNLKPAWNWNNENN